MNFDELFNKFLLILGIIFIVTVPIYAIQILYEGFNMAFRDGDIEMQVYFWIFFILLVPESLNSYLI